MGLALEKPQGLGRPPVRAGTWPQSLLPAHPSTSVTFTGLSPPACTPFYKCDLKVTKYLAPPPFSLWDKKGARDPRDESPASEIRQTGVVLALLVGCDLQLGAPGNLSPLTLQWRGGTPLQGRGSEPN